jgi:hypothetical protein
VSPTSGTAGAARAVKTEQPREVSEAPKARTVPQRITAEQRREGEARRKIAFILVWAYLAIITLDIIAPVIIVKLLGSKTGQINAVRTISEEIAPLITAVVGVLGFVLGYYFKSEEKEKH